MDAVVQWTEGGPELPVEVTQALEDGDLVLFCGAGVSVPAGLPLFKGLVQTVFESLPDKPTAVQELIEEGAYDRALYVLEQECGPTNVRKRIPPLLKIADDADLSTHSALLSLATNRDGTTRLITTNFDDGFERAGRAPCIDCAPKLPIPKKERWNSLVHLHGRLDRSDPECSKLVLSSADFGLAYLTERWASRFVAELFKRFSVLFVGYSVEDPVMRYMMDAIAADKAVGETWSNAYAFTGVEPKSFETEKRLWRNKGIQAIPYAVEGGNHDLLHTTLRLWADSHRQGLQGKEAIIRDNSQRPLVTSAARQVCWALRDHTGHPARVFATLDPAPPFEWLEVLERNELLAIQSPIAKTKNSFVTRSAAQHPRIDQRVVPLIHWVLTYMRDRRFTRWVIDHGSCLHPDARWMIRSKLRQAVDLPAGISKFWRIVASADFSRSFLESNGDPLLFESLRNNEWSSILRADILDALTPILRLTPPLSLFDEKRQSEERLSTFAQTEVKLRGQHEVAMIRQSIGQSRHRDRILLELADDLTTLLKRACDILELTEQANVDFDTSHIARPSIDDHPQNTDLASWTELIPLVRDSLLASASSDPGVARELVERWKAFAFPIFRRFVFYAAAKTEILDTTESVDCLLENDGRGLWLHFAQHEAFQLIEAIWPKLSEHDSRRLIEAILAGPQRDLFKSDLSEGEFEDIRRRLTIARLQILGRTTRRLPPEITVMLEQAGIPVLSDEERERISFPSYMRRSWGDPFMRMVDPQSDIRKLNDEDARRILLAVDPESPYLRSWYVLIRENPDRAISLISDGDETSWSPQVLGELIKGLPLHTMNADSWARLCAALVRADNIRQIAIAVAFALRQISKLCEGLNDGCLLNLWDLIVEPAIAFEDPLSERPVEQALNSPGGALAECIFDLVQARSGQGNSDVPPWVWTRLEKLALARGNGATLAQVILASRLSFLFWANRAWCEAHMLPLLDWDSNPNAAALWQGFLWQFSVAPDLWTLIKRGFLFALENHHRLGESAAAAASWFAAICIDQPTWIEKEAATQILKTLPSDGRAAAANVIWQRMAGSAEGADALWRERVGRWVNEAWPRNRELREPAVSTDLALAVLNADAEFPAAVSMILEVIDRGNVQLVAYEAQRVKTKHAHEHPVELLRLLSTLLDPLERTYGQNVRTVLQEVSTSRPEQVGSLEYQRLNVWLLEQGL